MVVLYNVGERRQRRGDEDLVAVRARRLRCAEAHQTADGRPIELVQAEYSLAIAARGGRREIRAEPVLGCRSEAAGGPHGLGLEAEAPTVTARGASRARPRSWARMRAAPGSLHAPTPTRKRNARRRLAAAAAAERERAAQAAAEQQRATEVAIEKAARLAAQEARCGRATSRGARAAIESVERRAADTRIRARARLGDRRRAVRDGHGQSERAGAREPREILGDRCVVPGARFTIEGHTDNVGSDATNSELSLRRAISVRDYLTGSESPPRTSRWTATARADPSPTTPQPRAARATGASRS